MSNAKQSLLARVGAAVRQVLLVDCPAEKELDTIASPCQPLPGSARHCRTLPDAAAIRVGTLRPPKEHAEMLARTLRQAGTVDTAIPVGDLQGIYVEMCRRLGWWPHHWDAVGREFARQPGVERKVVRVGGARPTLYQIAPTAEVVSLDARRRA